MDTEINDGHPAVAVAMDKDKGSQGALKWALDNVLVKGQTVTLLHVKTKISPNPPISNNNNQSNEMYIKEIFLPARCFCTRKDVLCNDVIIEDTDIAKAITEFLAQNGIEKIVLGAPVRGGFARFKVGDVPSAVVKGAPDYCTVYVISKGKVSTMKNSIRQAPLSQSSHRHQLQSPATPTLSYRQSLQPQFAHNPSKGEAGGRYSFDGKDTSFRSPFTRRGNNGKSYGELSMPETDISFVSAGRSSLDRMFPSLYDDDMDNHRPPRMSDCGYSDRNSDFMRPSLTGRPSSADAQLYHQESNRKSISHSSQATEEMEEEMRRLKLELRQTMDMYSTACREALTAKQKAGELHRWKMDEERRLQEARLAQEAALAIAEEEKAKCRKAMEAAEAAKRIAEMEAQRRKTAEMKARKEAEERKRAMNALVHNDNRYRKYTIEEIEEATEYFSNERKIGEGGYGPVYKCFLDHTPVAIKVLRPDAAQGRSQFQQEIEVLSCIRHPNMVLLLGACPDYGCLVYEYMANGSLEDRLFRRGNTPVLPWQIRFRIAAEIGTGLLFLHQTKPEPLVHRDLKPANILLDRNYVSKISDVGLARLVPPTVADNMTQLRMTSTAGTFCYIDPEYQQTGMLGIKSDIYSLGIMLLQIITGRPPMGLTHHVERAIERGNFKEMLDPSIPDWPVDEVLGFAKIAIKCAELRRKDRPDLGTVVLPELNRLRTLAEENMLLSYQCSSAAATSYMIPNPPSSSSSASSSSNCIPPPPTSSAAPEDAGGETMSSYVSC